MIWLRSVAPNRCIQQSECEPRVTLERTQEQQMSSVDGLLASLRFAPQRSTVLTCPTADLLHHCSWLDAGKYVDLGFAGVFGVYKRSCFSSRIPLAGQARSDSTSISHQWQQQHTPHVASSVTVLQRYR